jgi:hypothetical protein
VSGPFRASGAAVARAGAFDPMVTPPGTPEAVPRSPCPSDTVVEMEMQQADAEWAEALALRILLAGVQPERRAEAIERVRSLVRDLEAPGAAGSRRLPRMTGTSRRRRSGPG